MPKKVELPVYEGRDEADLTEWIYGLNPEQVEFGLTTHRLSTEGNAGIRTARLFEHLINLLHPFKETTTHGSEQIPHLQDQLLLEISKRTQGRGERVVEYLTCVKALHNRLVPPTTEHERIGKTVRNMLPPMQIQLVF